MTSPIDVINMPTRALLDAETKGSFVRWLAHLNIKRNSTSLFVNRYLPYWICGLLVQCQEETSSSAHWSILDLRLLGLVKAISRNSSELEKVITRFLWF